MRPPDVRSPALATPGSRKGINEQLHPEDSRSSSDLQAALLAELRCARMRAQLAMLEIDSAGTALKHGLVTPEQCLALLCERGAAAFLDLDRRAS